MMQQILDLARTSCKAAIAHLEIQAEASLEFRSSRSGFEDAESPQLDITQATEAFTEAHIVSDLSQLSGVPSWVQSLAIVPVTGPSAERGVLAIASPEPDAFSNEQLAGLASAGSLIEDRLDRAAEGIRFDAISTLLRENQEDLQSTRDRLEVSNQELEQFAYIAAHELVAPLRAVAAYAEILGDLVGPPDQTDEPVAACIAQIRDGVTLMNRQVQALLALSRAQTDTVELDEVDLGFVVEQALDTLAQPLSDIDAAISVGRLPKVVASVVPLQSVFANLISNAIRYRAPDRPLNIVIDSEPAIPEGWKVIVTDNGLGISGADRARVFQLFERASPDTDGSGIGLALSRRILEAFNASITVEPAEPSGSSFILHFPGA